MIVNALPISMGATELRSRSTPSRYVKVVFPPCCGVGAVQFRQQGINLVPFRLFVKQLLHLLELLGIFPGQIFGLAVVGVQVVQFPLMDVIVLCNSACRNKLPVWFPRRLSAVSGPPSVLEYGAIPIGGKILHMVMAWFVRLIESVDKASAFDWNLPYSVSTCGGVIPATSYNVGAMSFT